MKAFSRIRTQIRSPGNSRSQNKTCLSAIISLDQTLTEKRSSQSSEILSACVDNESGIYRFAFAQIEYIRFRSEFVNSHRATMTLLRTSTRENLVVE